MPFVRPYVFHDTMQRQGRTEGWVASPLPIVDSAGGDRTITAAMISASAAVFTGAGGAVNYVLDTVANILAAFPDMDIGDTHVFTVTNTTSHTATLNAAVSGVTFAGFTTATAQTRFGIIERTGVATLRVTYI